MATSPVNMVDAIADMIPRMATARTATMRVGKVIAASVNGQVAVQVGGSLNSQGQAITIMARYLVGYTPAVGNVVVLITDKDAWVILGRIATT